MVLLKTSVAIGIMNEYKEGEGTGNMIEGGMQVTKIQKN
jgi:hypothetical protein